MPPVLLPAPVWADLLALRGAGAPGDAGTEPDAPVFRSRKGGGAQGLRVRQAQRLVDAAARRAGLRAGVSPHWLRHAHALERGAPIHLVAATLGHASVATTGKYLRARPADSSSRYLAL
jgi:integrase/recombinase XerD